MSIFDNLTNKLTNFLDFGNSEVDLNTLSYDELLKKVSEINSENTSLQKKMYWNYICQLLSRHCRIT